MLTGTLDGVLPAVFALAAVLYLRLAMVVVRAQENGANNSISYLLFLIGLMVGATGIWYNATDPDIYGIGRSLSYFASGFMPVAFYQIYREFTAGKSSGLVIAMLSIVPLASTVLALTNDLHHLLWAVREADGAVSFSKPNEHFWYHKVHMPYVYGLFCFSLFSLTARLPSMALAHRRNIVMIILVTIFPFAVSVTNTMFGIGPIEFPFSASAFVLMLPVNWWLAIALKVHEFAPLAYQTMFDHVRDPIFVLDKSQRIVSANSPAQELLKTRERQLIGQRLWEDLPEAQAILSHSKDRDLKQTLKLNTERYFELSSAPLTSSKGRNMGTVVVCRDVTERKQALQALADSEHLIRSLIETSSNGILRFTGETGADPVSYRCIFANRAAERFLDTDVGTLVGMPLTKLELLEPRQLLEHFVNPNERRATKSYEISVETDYGENWLRVVAEPVGIDFSVTLIDITQRKHNESKMLADALRDPLTGILNRRGFENLATEAIATYDKAAILYLDLNSFKSINDRFGHQAGDALLKAFGHRLETCLRPEDVLARLGGDEFAIVLAGIEVEDAKHVARRLVETAFEAYIIQGQEIECTASVGIALMPDHGQDLWHLVSIADQAMYNAKHISKEEAANDKAAYVDAAIAS